MYPSLIISSPIGEVPQPNINTRHSFFGGNLNDVDGDVCAGVTDDELEEDDEIIVGVGVSVVMTVEVDTDSGNGVVMMGPYIWGGGYW